MMKTTLKAHKNRFSSVPRPSLRIPNGTKDIGGLVVPEEVTKEVVQQPEPELKRGKKNSTLKNFRPEFKLYLIEGTRDEDVAFWKEAINDEMDFIMGNNTWVLAVYLYIANLLVMDVKTAFLNGDLDEEVYMNKPQGFIMPGNENKVDLTKEFLSSRFSIKDIGEADVILVNTPMDTSEKLMPNNGQVVSHLEYSKMIGCLMYAMTCTRPDIAFAVGKLSRYTSNPGIQHWQAILHVLKYLKKTMDYSLTYTAYPSILVGYIDASWISNTKDNSSTSGWVFLLNEATGKEAEWLRNLILEIPLWSKPITLISIRCDSAATLMIGCLMYAMTCTRPDIAFAVGKLSRYTSNPGIQHWQAILHVLKYLKKTMDYSLTYTAYPSILVGYIDASWISNTKDNSSTSGWVFLLNEATGKEAEWLRNLILEIPLWSKPITPISIRCDSAATLVTAYSQMYNVKSRHLGVRHRRIHELITNTVVSIEFVRSQQNLVDHLMKGLARDLVIKFAEGMGLKSN
uniref:Zinc finger, CCHC-type n=1 Tax=Tanacetum cinerariifolium TaxID=118510 RepID=A0A6L2L633_TANCI|nr:zinc finger, CCHC-type [Tanacetum cinerariifolium]